MGNIIGNVLANFLKENLKMTWMGSFRVIGIIVAVIAVLNIFLLRDNPGKVGIVIEVPESEGSSGQDEEEEQKEQNAKLKEKLVDSSMTSDGTIIKEEKEEKAISFWKAWLLPGVIPFVLCIACVKCATYGMLFWLPSYAKKELKYSHTDVEIIAIAYDIGTIFGSIILGKITDITYKRRSPVAFFGLLIGGVLFMLVVFLHDSSKYLLYAIIFFVGWFVGGIFNIVAATAAADLAKGDSLKGNDKALSTVSGILDGSGSLGAAFGSLIIGAIRQKSWNGVFIFLA